EEGGDDEQEYDEDEYDEETRDEESFDHIPKTPKNSDDEGNGEEDLGFNIGREEGHDKKEEEDELYRDININQGRGKQPATTSKAKSLSALSEVAMIEAQQLKLATKKSLHQTHISQASGSGADEGTGSIPGVLDVPTNKFEEEISWNSTDKEGDDDEGKDGDSDDKGNDGDDDEEGDDDDDDDDD
nr:hypothetical protein [Tanacetum cinerariifolium]